MREYHIAVAENADEDIPITLKSYNAARDLVGIDLTQYSDIEFYIKDDKEAPEGTAVATRGGGEITYVTDGTDGKMTVAIARANHATPGTKRYFIRGILSGKYKPLAHGNYVIEDF